MRLYIEDIRNVSPNEYHAEYNLLSESQRARIDQYPPDDKKRSMLGKILLRRGIKELYGKSNYEIYYNNNGKPELDFCYFSISHSNEFAVCAISDKPIGVDIEFFQVIKKRTQYLLFSKDESDFINSVESKRMENFIRIWTMKESYIKAEGLKLIDSKKFNLIENACPVSGINGFEFSTQMNEKYMVTICERAF